MSLKPCPKCHKKLAASRTICPHCGNNLNQTEPTTTPPPPIQPKPSKKTNRCPKCDGMVARNVRGCPHCGHRFTTSFTKVFMWMTLFFVVFSTIVINSRTEETAGKAGPPKKTLEENIKLEFVWSTTASGNIMEADFTITNNNTFSIKDISIKCIHSGKSGTIIDSNNHTIFEVVNAHETKSFYTINMGFIHSQANTSRCGVTKAKSL